MDDQTLKTESLHAYLLGTLSAEEMESFDELSFTDEDFSERLNAAEKDLIDSYVRGELKGAKLERLESYYLATPLRRRKVEFAHALQDFGRLRAAETSNAVSAAADAPRKPTSESTFRFWKLFSFSSPVTKWGIAFASVLFVVAAGWLWIENTRLNDEIGKIGANRTENSAPEAKLQNGGEREPTAGRDPAEDLPRRVEEQRQPQEESKKEQANAENPVVRPDRTPGRERPAPSRSVPPPRVSVASFVLRPSLRSSGQAPEFRVPPGTERVAVELQLEPVDFTNYRVELTDPSGRVVWRSNRLKAKIRGDEQSLNVGFPANLLRPHVYSLVVSGVNAAGDAEIISNYPFRVVLK